MVSPRKSACASAAATESGSVAAASAASARDLRKLPILVMVRSASVWRLSIRCYPDFRGTGRLGAPSAARPVRAASKDDNHAIDRLSPDSGLHRCRTHDFGRDAKLASAGCGRELSKQ